MPPLTHEQHGSLRFTIPLAAILLIVLGCAAPQIYAFMRQDKPYGMVDLKAMGNFPYDPEKGSIKDVPRRLRALDGKRIEAEGFVAPPNAASQRSGEFQLVHNFQSHHGPPQVQERIYMKGRPGQQFTYTDDYVKVRGTLHVNVKRDPDGVVQSVYEMDVDRIEPGDAPDPKPDPVAKIVNQSSTAMIWIGGVVLVVWGYRRMIAISNARHEWRKGLCPVCGYDVRATPHRCPECGSRVDGFLR